MYDLVINQRHGSLARPRRVQRLRTKGWRMPPGAVYVGRPTRWGNPFNATQIAVARHCEPRGSIPLIGLYSKPSIERCLDMYLGWLIGRLNADPEFVMPLVGKDLVCWCPLDRPCHADVLIRVANGIGGSP